MPVQRLINSTTRAVPSRWKEISSLCLCRPWAVLPPQADLREEGDMELVKNSFLHSTLQQLRLHKLPGMQRDSSSFSFSHDNLGFYFCFRLLVVKVVLVHGNAWKAFAPKRTIITPQAGLNECLQKPKHIIHGNLQNKPEKKVGICQIQSLENMFRGEGRGTLMGTP